ncbi:MAG TPA: hypothetical protein VNN07_12675 [Candidatus Tectomicrobia bacterium]|nr:hypothetical protein [Candidatus Tectomicrobia bacterium]
MRGWNGRRARMLAGMSALAMAGVLAGCAQPFWTRPETGLPRIARDANRCYETAVAPAGAALPAAAAAERRGALLPATQPPPELWERAPGDSGFTRFDEQLRYEACMTRLGYRPTRPRPAPWPFGS